MEQIEAARCELDTYTFLKKHEDGNFFIPTILLSYYKCCWLNILFCCFSAAIPNRVEVIRQDVMVQMEREREMQTRFQQLQDKCFEASQSAP